MYRKWLGKCILLICLFRQNCPFHLITFTLALMSVFYQWKAPLLGHWNLTQSAKGLSVAGLSQHTEAETKWSFWGRHFPIHLLPWNFLHYWLKFYAICSQSPIDNKSTMVQVMAWKQAITWTIDGHVLWQHRVKCWVFYRTIVLIHTLPIDKNFLTALW